MKQQNKSMDTLIDGKYRVLGSLGKGGMGEVFDVLHEQIGKKRALKVLRGNERLPRDMVCRFQREMIVDAAIQNPHVVEVLDAGEMDEGRPYFVMERLEGETLAQLIRRRGCLDLYETIDIITQVCEGIQAAHDAGIIHRDLKPANLFVTTREGKPFIKILDFGIAKFLRPDTDDSTITHEGTLLGTPCYMSPEQIRGNMDMDARVDVYALGVILYECVAGHPPYRADSTALLGVLICEGLPTPLENVRTDLPPVFCNIVRQAMAGDRKKRFSSARQLGEALQDVANGCPTERVVGDDGVAWMRPTVRLQRPGYLPQVNENAPGATSSSKVRSAKRGLLLAAVVIAVAMVTPFVFAQWAKVPDENESSKKLKQPEGKSEQSAIPLHPSASGVSMESDEPPWQSSAPPLGSQSSAPTTSKSSQSMKTLKPKVPDIVKDPLPTD